MILILAESLYATEAGAAKACSKARDCIEQTRREAGCFQYDFARDAVNPLLVRVIERWKDGAAIKSHMEKPYLQAFLKVMGEIEVKSIKVKVYDAANEREFDRSEFE